MSVTVSYIVEMNTTVLQNLMHYHHHFCLLLSDDLRNLIYMGRQYIFFITPIGSKNKIKDTRYIHTKIKHTRHSLHTTKSTPNIKHIAVYRLQRHSS